MTNFCKKPPHRVFFAFHCKKIGKWNKQFLQKSDMKRKVEKIEEYSKHLGSIKLLTVHTKDTVF